jgi:hypothetical protein
MGVCVYACSLDIVVQIKTWSMLWVFFFAAFRKLQDCIIEKEKFEDLKDLLFLLDFIL